MVATWNVKRPIGGDSVLVTEERGSRKLGLFSRFGFSQTIPPLAHSVRRFGTEPGRVNGFKIRGKFRSGGGGGLPEFVCFRAGRPLDLKQPDLGFGYLLNMTVNLPAGNRRYRSASASGVMAETHIAWVFPVTVPGHDMPAACAPDEFREQRRVTVRFSAGSVEPDLEGSEHFRVKDRFMSGRVGVVTYGEFPEVNPVSEHVPQSVRGHSELPGNLYDRYAVKDLSCRVLDLLSLAVRDEATGVGVTVIAAGGLASLPDSPFDGCFPCPLEAFAAFFEFVLVDRGKQVALETSGRGGAVHVFAGAVHDPAGGFDFIPKVEHEAKVTSCPAEVSNHDSCVDPGLDSADGFVEDGAGVVGSFGVEFGVEHVDLVAVEFGPAHDFVGLVFGGSKVFSSSYMADSSISGEHRWGVYIVKVSRSTRGLVNRIMRFSAFSREIERGEQVSGVDGLLPGEIQRWEAATGDLAPLLPGEDAFDVEVVMFPDHEAAVAAAVEERDREIERLRQGLWDCAGAAGTDLDGDPTPDHMVFPDIVDFALGAVRELRRDYEEDFSTAGDDPGV